MLTRCTLVPRWLISELSRRCPSVCLLLTRGSLLVHRTFTRGHHIGILSAHQVAPFSEYVVHQVAPLGTPVIHQVALVGMPIVHQAAPLGTPIVRLSVGPSSTRRRPSQYARHTIGDSRYARCSPGGAPLSTPVIHQAAPLSVRPLFTRRHPSRYARCSPGGDPLSTPVIHQAAPLSVRPLFTRRHPSRYARCSPGGDPLSTPVVHQAAPLSVRPLFIRRRRPLQVEASVSEQRGEEPRVVVVTFVLCGVIAASVLVVIVVYTLRRHRLSRDKLAQLTGDGGPAMQTTDPSKDYQVRRGRCRARLHVRPSVRVCVRPSVHPPVRPSVRPSVRPFVRPSAVRPSAVRPSVRPSTCPSVCPSVRPSVCQLIRPSTCPSVHLSICPSTYIPARLPLRLLHPSLRFPPPYHPSSSPPLPILKLFSSLPVIPLLIPPSSLPSSLIPTLIPLIPPPSSLPVSSRRTCVGSTCRARAARSRN